VVVAIATIAGAIASFLGLYALYQGRVNRRVKLLAYETTPPVPLASASPVEATYKLSIRYERPGSRVEIIDAAYITYLRFANFGREPIRANDIAPGNKLRVEAEVAPPGEVLDISLASGGRPVTAVAISDLTALGRVASADVRFDYLDYHDGGVVRVLSTVRPRSVVLAGDIIGMPEGISRSDEPPARGIWGKVGAGLWIIAEFASVALTFFAFRWVTGAWNNAWLMVVILPAIILPGIIALFVGDTVWPSNRREFPKELELPRWLGFHMLRGISMGGERPPAFEPLIEQTPQDPQAESERG
jgi:hypothetical protein